MSTKIKWTVGIILMAASLAFTGCGKKSPPPQAPAPNGVTVDMPKLRQEFAKGTPDQQNLVSQVGMGIRYGDHISSLAALDKLVNSPGITDSQKKTVNEVIEQIKQVINKAQPK